MLASRSVMSVLVRFVWSGEGIVGEAVSAEADHAKEIAPGAGERAVSRP